MPDNAFYVALNTQLTVPWFVQENDLIGGWCVTNVDMLPSQMGYHLGELVIADMMTEPVARHIVELHNRSLS